MVRVHRPFSQRVGGGKSNTPAIEPKRLEPVPLADWPPWAKGFKMERDLAVFFHSEAAAVDTGVGDTVHRLIGPAASDAFKKWHLERFGYECGCEARRAQWNTIYPYSKNSG